MNQVRQKTFHIYKRSWSLHIPRSSWQNTFRCIYLLFYKEAKMSKTESLCWGDRPALCLAGNRGCHTPKPETHTLVHFYGSKQVRNTTLQKVNKGLQLFRFRERHTFSVNAKQATFYRYTHHYFQNSLVTHHDERKGNEAFSLAKHCCNCYFISISFLSFYKTG